MSPIPIIDAHIHFWDLQNPYPWLQQPDANFERMFGNYDKIRSTFLPPDYRSLSSSYGVVETVHIEAHGFPADPVQETQWLTGLVASPGVPSAIVAFADLSDPDAEAVLQRHCAFSLMRGLRQALSYHETPWRCIAGRGDYLKDPAWLKGYALLSKYNLSFDLLIYDHQARDAAGVARRFPDTTMIVEHLGWPTDLSEKGFRLWQERMELLAACPNTLMKLSGIGIVLQGRDPGRYLTAALELFGPDRCLFGSNFPPDRLFIEFGELIDAVRRHVPRSYHERVFCENARRTYRL